MDTVEYDPEIDQQPLSVDKILFKLKIFWAGITDPIMYTKAPRSIIIIPERMASGKPPETLAGVERVADNAPLGAPEAQENMEQPVAETAELTPEPAASPEQTMPEQTMPEQTMPEQTMVEPETPPAAPPAVPTMNNDNDNDNDNAAKETPVRTEKPAPPKAASETAEQMVAQIPEKSPPPKPMPEPVSQIKLPEQTEVAIAPPPPPVLSPPTSSEQDFNRGQQFYKGIDVPKDFKAAAEFFEKAAVVGHKNAQFNLGTMYYTGKGVDKDLSKAISWFKKAAQQGHTQAEFNLGFLYYTGSGVTKNDVLAYRLISAAADKGYAKAIQARDTLAKSLPPAVIKQAESPSGN